jgi:hypothetical protein
MRQLLRKAAAFGEARRAEQPVPRVATEPAAPVGHGGPARKPAPASSGPLPASSALELEEAGLVLPAEHIVAHKELKKVYAFCQSGSVATLRHLFGMLLALEGAHSAGSDTEPAGREGLRSALLRQMRVWATFADQLAALRAVDGQLLDRVHEHLLGQIRRRAEGSASAWPAEDVALCWQVLIVGWDHLCRSAQQQVDALTLALRESAPEAVAPRGGEAGVSREPLPSSLPTQGRQLPLEATVAARREPGCSLYSLLLGEPSRPAASSGRSPAGRLAPLPLELFHARCLGGHPSFYELEVLNKSTVKSYLVALEAQVYKKAIGYITTVARSPQAESPRSPEQIAAGLDVEAGPAAGGVVTAEAVYLPARPGALAQPPRQVFDDYATVPIPLAAVPSQIKAPAPQLAAALGRAEQPPSGKHGKKGAATRGAPKAQEPSSALQRGFLLKEITWKRATRAGGVAPSDEGSPVGVTSRLFSAPLGSAFTSDPLVLEGGSADQLSAGAPAHPAWALQRPARERLAMLRGSGALLDEEAGEGADWAEALRGAQRTHRAKSEALVEAFIAQIEASFATPAAPQASQGQYAPPAESSPRCWPDRCQATLVKAFAGLCMQAQAENPTLRSPSDLELLGRVLKLVQLLLERELALVEQKKAEVLRLSAIAPLIRFLMQTLSVSSLGDSSTIPLVGYKLLPGLINVIALLKEAFRVFDLGKEPSNAGSSPRGGMNLLDCLQALTSEGVDFARERVFETPHPYPQNDFSQSETIEVPKAIGFIVELDRRCSAEHTTDQLVMYSGSDHIFQINPSFATQIKMSTKPNTRQPYLLLGNRMKIDFRSYSQRQRRGRGGAAAGHLPPAGGEAGQRRAGSRNPQGEARWGFRVIVRPVYSEPQNIVLSGQVRAAQRKAIYQQLGGERACHEAEVMLNSLVCLAS